LHNWSQIDVSVAVFFIGTSRKLIAQPCSGVDRTLGNHIRPHIAKYRKKIKNEYRPKITNASMKINFPFYSVLNNLKDWNFELTQAAYFIQYRSPSKD